MNFVPASTLVGVVYIGPNTITVAQTGDYLITYTLLLTIEGGSTEASFALFVNNIIQNNSKFGVFVDTFTGQELVGQVILNLQAGSAIDLRSIGPIGDINALRNNEEGQIVNSVSILIRKLSV